MSIRRGEINPLSVLDLRKLSFIPEHFSKLTVDRHIDLRSVESWIETNLNSRYAITPNLKVDDAKKIIHIVTIGLEDPKELTMLTLGCQHLYKERTF